MKKKFGPRSFASPEEQQEAKRFWEQAFCAALSGLVTAATDADDKPERAAEVADHAMYYWGERFPLWEEET